MAVPNLTDDAYLAIIRGALSVCRHYKPRFGGGQKGGYSLEEFRALYQQDPFYAWFGLDSPLVYAAHKAAGGITSVYRQLGIACERLFRRILQDQLSLSDEDSRWSYKVPSTSGKVRTLTLDGRIPIAAVKANGCADRLSKWLSDASRQVQLSKRAAAGLRGSVFEVRQGYKSADSKRQNADIANAANAYANRYLPCVVLLPTRSTGALPSDTCALSGSFFVERFKAAPWNRVMCFCEMSLDMTWPRFSRAIPVP